MADQWYYAQGQNRVGPMPLAQLIQQLPSVGGAQALVYGPGFSNWVAAGQVPQIAQAMSGGGMMARGGGGGSPPIPASAGGRRSHDIDYEVFGSEMQYAVITLDQGETVIAEPGGFMFMDMGIEMKTVFGDPNKEKSGFFDKLKTAGKRLLTGESMFMSTFTNIQGGRQKVAFAAPYPGKIIALRLSDIGGEIICQKDSFLCAAKGTDIGIAFQKKMGVGLFGGEGFIMQRLTGDGVALVHAGGTLMERDLQPGETLKIDTGCVVSFTPSVSFDIQFVGGFKNTLFGGEGLFFATLTGPGRIWLQSLPFARLAGRVLANSGGGKEEGSLLGGLGRMFDGDNA
jgi:uncharacterized protein (TIGR00266 family)